MGQPGQALATPCCCQQALGRLGQLLGLESVAVCHQCQWPWPWALQCLVFKLENSNLTLSDIVTVGL
jgi:hypothetical protein